jgi:serine/threonine-protein kinase RsbW
VNEHVELTIPARPEFLSLVRLSVGAAASRLDMTIDEIDDLQLAVEELCIALFTSSDHEVSRLTTTITADHEVVEVVCRLDGATTTPVIGAVLLPDSLSRKILDALVDEHTLGADGGAPTASLRKRRQRNVTSP